MISIYYTEEGFRIVLDEPERGKSNQFDLQWEDCVPPDMQEKLQSGKKSLNLDIPSRPSHMMPITRREKAFLDLDDLEVLKKLAIGLVEHRIIFNKTEEGEYADIQINMHGRDSRWLFMGLSKTFSI